MITKITSGNKVAYMELFDKANQVLNLTEEDPGYIYNLDKYFIQLNTLVAALNEAGKSDDIKQFIRLPLDEPTFDIDANSRAITVPAEFKKNGISVKDDEIAETLYFSIDRYYDTIDLLSPGVNIVIQWESAPGADKKATQGLSTALFRDGVLVDGDEKVVFGWAINNKITKNAGTIKFAVRFYMVENDAITFNLNTLVQSATIQPGITYDLKQPIENDYNRIVTRLLNSAGPEISDDEAFSAPEFIVPLIPSAEVFISQDVDSETGLINYKADLDENGALMLEAAAVNNADGILSYQWINKIDNDSQNSLGEIAYLPATGNYKANIPYYKFIEEDNVYVRLESGEYTVGEEIEDGAAFIKGSSNVINQIGTYTVEARNTNAAAGTYKATKSNTIEIIGPDGVVETALNDEAVEANGTKGIVLYSSAGLGIVLSEGQEKDKVIFTWKDITDVDDTKKFEEANRTAVKAMDATGKAQDSIALIDIPVEKLDVVHKIQVNYTISRNGKDIESDPRYFEVALAPNAPENLIVTAFPGRVNAEHPVRLTATINAVPAYYDNPSYIWIDLAETYQENVDNLDWATVRAAAVARLNAEEDIEGNVTRILDGHDSHIDITVPGWYACIAVNSILNGEVKAATELPKEIYDGTGNLISTALVHVGLREG